MKIWPYWTIETYGRGRLIRELTGYSRSLPLCAYSNHGVKSGGIQPHEWNTDAPIVFFEDRRHVDAYRRASTKPVYQMRSPFADYRRAAGIERLPDARGTIAFPHHSTPSIDDGADGYAYAEELANLPAPFQPVTVCVHHHDVMKRRHEVFRDRGMNVVTAGNPLDSRFPDRLYELLREHAFATSNTVATATFYAVEMGIPFFLFGPESQHWNVSDSNYAPGRRDRSELARTAAPLFTYENLDSISVTDEQASFARRILGLDGGLDWRDVNRLLHEALRKWAFSTRPVVYVTRQIRKRLVPSAQRGSRASQ
jgi:hypothetical protein